MIVPRGQKDGCQYGKSRNGGATGVPEFVDDGLLLCLQLVLLVYFLLLQFSELLLQRVGYHLFAMYTQTRDALGLSCQQTFNMKVA